MEELSFISTEEILKELLARFDHCIFVGRKKYKEDHVTTRDFKGSSTLCLGLCTLAQQLVLDSWLKEQQHFSKNQEDVE